MPFLVDSLSMAIRDTGAPIDWLVHPIMAVARNGGRWDVLADDGETESLTHIEFEPFPQTSAYAALEATVAGLIADIRVIVDDFSSQRTKVVELAAKHPGEIGREAWRERVGPD